MRRNYYYENKTFSSYSKLDLSYTPPTNYTRLGFTNVFVVGAVVNQFYIEESSCTDSKIVVWNCGSSVTCNINIYCLYIRSDYYKSL